MATVKRELTTLRFEGPRFEDHGLEIDVLPELVAYKKLLLETAKELWRRNHPDRERLPKGFETSVSIKFFRLAEGSTAVPLEREVHIDEGTLPFVIDDELDEAAETIEATIEAAGAGLPMPENLPGSVVPLFGDFGKGLSEGESIYAQARKRPREARYTTTVRTRLLHLVEPIYEDMVDISGEIRATDLDGCNFTLRQENGRKLPGKFAPEQEAEFTEALRNHTSRRLRIRGLGEFSQQDRALRRILRVDIVRPSSIEPLDFDYSTPPIWDTAVNMGAAVPVEEWAKVPTDLAENIHDYLYGAPKDSA